MNKFKIFLGILAFFGLSLGVKAQEDCDTLKWKSLKTHYLDTDGSSFYNRGELDSITINIDTFPVIYFGYNGVNISNDTFFANEKFTIGILFGFYADTGHIGHMHQTSTYDFKYDFSPNDTLRVVCSASIDLPSLMNQIKQHFDVELEKISYFQVIMSITATSKDGNYSDSVGLLGRDISTFFLVRNPVNIKELQNTNYELRVYPTPTNGQITIECRDGACPVSTEEYIIYSVMGQVVMCGALTCRDAACHVPTLRPTMS